MWKFFPFFPLFLFAGWAEQTLSEMTLEEKVGQLLVAPGCSLRDVDHWEDWVHLMAECRIGNVLAKQGDPESQVRFLHFMQGLSKYPLLVAADYEWGLAMMMKTETPFPKSKVLGQIGDLDLIFETGREIARQARLVGVHLDLAPVADVNNNPDNPIIGVRSFGDDPEQVAECVSSCLRGIQSMGIYACAKHFPGHGDTNIDSHKDLPLIPHNLKRLQQVEFVPFQKAIQDGVKAIMIGHLLVPALDPYFPAPLSSACLVYLREVLGFKGLIVSDALNMKALTKLYSVEQIALLAREAGCDLLLYGAHLLPDVDDLMKNQVPRAYRALLDAYREGLLDLAELDESVLRILHAKEEQGLHLSREIPQGVLHTQEGLDLQKKLFALSPTP